MECKATRTTVDFTFSSQRFILTMWNVNYIKNKSVTDRFFMF
ncbi:hypothetical protein [Clostridioides difficile]|nr:hypothetical protein [Clostridioides difficile]MDE3652920.1 hypothetical protein [Clostridioides difficile]